MNEEQKKLFEQLRQVLPDLFYEEYDARAVLENAGRARGRQSSWHNPATFWDAELRALLQGAVLNGIPALIIAAVDAYPANAELSAIHAEVTLDSQAPERPPREEDQDEPPGTEAKPDLGGPVVVEPPPQQFHTVTLIGSERHDDFLRLVRQLVDPDADPCYSTTAQSGQLPQSAVLISDPGPRAAQIEDELLAQVQDWGEGVDVAYQTSEVRPYLLRRIVVSGTDNRRFELRNVPSTTVLSEIARAVLQNYTDDSTRSRRGRVRTTIDRVGADGGAERVDAGRTLSAAGIQDGDELRLATEATAGAGTALWRENVLRAREQIHRYARANPDFTIAETDDSNLPTRYTVEFHARGFAPPLDLEARPLVPRLQSEHRVMILLPANFPVGPPVAVFMSEIFHPNVLAASVGRAPRGFACLGALTDSYRPDMDFGQLCQMLVNMAGYREYEPRDLQEDDSEGYLNRPAARWASSEAGQQRIADRGGLRLAKLANRTGPDQDKERRLDVRPLDERAEDYEDEG
ncbi:MAG TPA: effector-associated domain EAD1-containing protein [Streptosporangiaceae bacterium]|nr:effector-associated domain EAD1-containing protein [Streptosporangiaceae bacterium]